MKAMSSRNDDPQHASRPFDVDRDGFVMAEGAGALILEDYEHAVKRGARIYAEVTGAAMTADAYHMTSTHPEGNRCYKGYATGVERIGISIGEVDHLNMHATSTHVGDLSELKAVLALGNIDRLKISATKSIDRAFAWRCRCCRSNSFHTFYRDQGYSSNYQYRSFRSGYPIKLAYRFKRIDQP